MVPGSGSGLLVNEAGVLAVGENCCTCNGCSCFPSCQPGIDPPGVWTVDWEVNFSFGTLTGSAENGDAGMTWRGVNCDDAGLNCPDCSHYPVSVTGGYYDYSYVAGCGGHYQSLFDDIKAMCLANSTPTSVTQISDVDCNPIDPVTVTIDYPHDVIDWDDLFWDSDSWKVVFGLFCADHFASSNWAQPRIIGYAGISSAQINFGPTDEGLASCSVTNSETFDTPIDIPTTCVYDYGTDPITYNGFTVTYGKTG